MNGKHGLKATGIMIGLLLVLGWLAGCNHQSPVTPPNTRDRQPAASAPSKSGLESTADTLMITSSGIKQPVVYNLQQLQEMEGGKSSACYSTLNNWPAKRFYVGKGVRISYLLKRAGVKPGAGKITVWAADGYCASFTRSQLEEQRYCFPGLMNGSEESAREVPAILAWESRAGSSNLSETDRGKLCLLFGQKGINDVTAAVFVKDVIRLEVVDANPGRWARVEAKPAPGMVKPGTLVYLEHPQTDGVKIYYSIDGSIPDEKSMVYNPSTSYYQPDLTRPIRLDKSVAIKAVAIGFGKNNSEVATFKYQVR